MFAGSKVGLGVKVAGLPRFYRRYDNEHRAMGWMSRLARTVFPPVDSNGSVSIAATASSNWTRTVTPSICRGMPTGCHRYAADRFSRGESCAPITRNTLMAAKSTTTASMHT
ncbi:hypothetical protein KCP71_21740 [Salmonella enterica subsp. enterica]|nr:hypothetical protein KCP71_21740 [Salmonella enterica subsp. enterica]